jgi:hypothetical protein
MQCEALSPLPGSGGQGLEQQQQQEGTSATCERSPDSESAVIVQLETYNIFSIDMQCSTLSMPVRTQLASSAVQCAVIVLAPCPSA